MRLGGPRGPRACPVVRCRGFDETAAPSADVRWSADRARRLRWDDRSVLQ